MAEQFVPNVHLLGTELQRAGLAFMEAKAVHSPGGRRIDEIVCETPQDVQKISEWAHQQGYTVCARVGTAEEISEYKRWL